MEGWAIEDSHRLDSMSEHFEDAHENVRTSLGWVAGD